MLDYQKLAELLFPHVSALPEDMEAAFPKRELPEGAKVTRFAPSPTGFVHFGGLFPTTVAERLAHQSGGVLYLRIEDTDAKREVPGAAEGLIKTLAKYGINIPETVLGNVTNKDMDAFSAMKNAEALNNYRLGILDNKDKQIEINQQNADSRAVQAKAAETKADKESGKGGSKNDNEPTVEEIISKNINKDQKDKKKKIYSF